MRGVINRYQALIYSILLFFMLNLFKDKMPSGTNQVLGGIVIIMIIACMYPLKLNEVRILTFYLICAIYANLVYFYNLFFNKIKQ